MTQPATCRSCASVSPPCSPSLWPFKITLGLRGRFLIGSRCIRLHMTSLPTVAASDCIWLLFPLYTNGFAVVTVFFSPLGTFFPLSSVGNVENMFNIFEHIFKVIRTNFCPVYILVFESQLKGRRKAGASRVGRSRRSRKWTCSAPPPCWTSTTSRTTWPTACSCAASAGQAPPRRRRAKARLKRERFPAPLSCREQNPGKRKQDHATVARKIDFTEDSLRCKLECAFLW